MTTTPVSLQDLRRRIYVTAKADKTKRFWGRYVHVVKRETLRTAYALAKRNNGAPGIDGVTFAGIEAAGLEAFLAQLRDELVTRTYRPLPDRRVRDGEILHLLKLMLKASGKRGVPQGGVLSPLLANIYLTEVDAMLERATTVTREGAYTRVDYARYADDLVILVDWHRRHDWLLRAVHRRLREELAKLDLRLNENKSRIVDLRPGGTVGFLGFDFRRVRSVRGVWRAQVTPKLTQRTALLGKLRDVFGRSQSQPVGRVIAEINPSLRRWVNYFRIGNASRCLAYVRLWVEQRVRRHLMRAGAGNGLMRAPRQSSTLRVGSDAMNLGDDSEEFVALHRGHGRLTADASVISAMEG